MPIRLPRTTLPAQPQLPQLGAQPIAGATVAPVGNATQELAGGAQEVAGLAAQLFQQQRDQEVMTRVAELDIERRKADGDVLAAYSTLQGKDAVEKRGEMMQRLEANSRRLRDGIKDATVAQVWARQDAALSLSSTQQLDSHYRRENIRWQADTQASRAELLVQDLGRVAFGEGYDPATGRLSAEAERTRSAYLDAVGNLGQLEGWSAERVELERRRADNVAIGQVAQQLLTQERLDEADALLKAHGDKLDLGTRQALERESQRRKDDRQAFDAARWAEQQPGNLVQQIEALNRYVEGGAMSLPVRDAAEQRLRAAEALQWQTKMREGNAAIDEMEQFAQLNRTGTYDELPLALRQQLEATGRETAARNWFQQGGQFTTTNEGFNFLLSANDDFLLRNSRDSIVAMRHWVSPGDLAGVLRRWDTVHGAARDAQAKAGRLPDGLIESETMTRMQDREMLPVEGASDEDTARYRRVVAAVKKAAANQPAKDPSELIDQALADTLFVDERELPILAFTPKERSTGYYKTSADGQTQFAQVSDDLVRKELDRRNQENAKVRAWNQEHPEQQLPLLATDRPTMLRELTAGVRKRESDAKTATAAAVRWMEAQVRQGRGDGGAITIDDAWHTLPNELRAALQAAGAEDMTRMQWLARKQQQQAPTFSPYRGGPAGGGLFRVGR